MDAEPHKNSADHENTSDTNFENDFNAAFKTILSPLENNKIINVIDNYTFNFSSKLSGFIGKKIYVDFNSIESLCPKEILKKYDHMIMSQFVITGQSGNALFILDKPLLNFIINLLYGNSDSIGTNEVNFGKCSLKIAQKAASFNLSSLKVSLSEYIEFDASLLQSTVSAKEIVLQDLQSRVYEITFKVCYKDFSGLMAIVLPESLIEIISFNATGVKKTEPHSDRNLSGKHLQNEVGDTYVDLVASFPKIKLKFSEIVNLLPGDCIPIEDPTQVELTIGNKKAFYALVGQSDNKRIVKITESMAGSDSIIQKGVSYNE